MLGRRLPAIVITADRSPELEENVRRTLYLAETGWRELAEPATVVLFALFVLTCLWPVWQWLRQRRAGSEHAGSRED